MVAFNCHRNVCSPVIGDFDGIWAVAAPPFDVCLEQTTTRVPPIDERLLASCSGGQTPYNRPTAPFRLFFFFFNDRPTERVQRIQFGCRR